MEKIINISFPSWRRKRMEKFKTSKKLLSILIALMMIISSYPLSYVFAADKVTEECTVCHGSGKVTCTAEGCTDGKVEVSCSACSGTGQVDETCAICSGTGQVGGETCADCSGSGTVKVNCTDCSATGKVEENCTACNGTGKVKCENCQGTGEVQNEYEVCPDCEGNKTVEVNCSTCSGTGKVKTTCSVCHGNGEVDGNVDCSVCHGTGTVTGEVSCDQCSGTGDDGGSVCSKCEGTGIIDGDVSCEKCSGSGLVTGKVTCTNCDGEGEVDTNCTDCSGTGKITETCSRCAGKGKILTENDDTFTFETPAPSAIKVGDDLDNAAESEKNTTGEITYKSSDEAIATVDENGKVTAHKAGTVKITASIKTDYVYSSKEIEYNLTIEEGVPTITDYTVTAIDYQQTLADSTFTSITAIAGSKNVTGTAVWKTTTVAPTVSDSNTTEYTAVFTPDDTDNYETVEFNATLEVKPINITGITVTGTTQTYDGNTYDAVSVSGTEAGDTIEYSTNGTDYTDSIPQITKVSDTTPIYVKVTRNENYNIYTDNSAIGKINPEKIGNNHFNVYSGVYDGTAHKAVEVTNPTANGENPVDYYVYEGNSYTECPEFIDVGEYDLTVVLNSNYVEDEDDPIEVPLRAVITQKNVTVQTADRTETYNAKPYSAITTDATVTLAGSDKLESCVADGAFTNVGTYDINVKDAVIKRGDIDATANYNITYQKGTLTINQKNVTITLKDVNATYTALPHPDSEHDYTTPESRYDISGLVDGSGHKAELVFDGEETEVGEYADKLDVSSYKILEGDTDVTANYNVTVVKGKLTIAYPTFDNYTYVKDDSDEGVRDWYQKDVTIKADDGYQVCYTNNDANAFSDTIIYDTEGVTKPKFAIKDLTTGFVSEVVERDEVKLDKVDPEADAIVFEASITQKLLTAITFGIYNPSTEATLKGTDTNSKIYSITYTIKEQNLTDDTWTTKEPVEVKAGDPSLAEFTTNVPFSGSFRSDIEYCVTDESGRTSSVITDTKGVITDSVAPDKPVITVDENASYASKDTFATDFNYHITIKDDNSGIGNVEVTLNDKTLTEDANGKLIKDYYYIKDEDNNELLISDFSFDINTNQLDNRAEDGVYTLNVKVTDNANNESEASYTAYIDVYAPMITEFKFDSKGNVYSGFEDSYDNPIIAECQSSDTNEYNYYFEKNTYVTVYAYDYDNSGLNNHTSGINKDIKLIAESAKGEEVTCTEVADSFVQTTDSGVGYSEKTFLVKGPFKGNLYALAEDYAGNYPSNKQEDDTFKHGFVLSEYVELMSAKYEGYVNPYDTILEDAGKHKATSSIVIKPTSTPVSTETYNYSYKYEGEAQKDASMDYSESKVPLYKGNATFNITVNDSYSGIREISWSIIGQSDQDSKNDQTGTVKVNNLGATSGDDGWTPTKEEGSNLITSMSKDITVKNNSNDIVILVELTDRSGNKSFDYYVLSIDTTKPDISVSVSGSATNGKYFNTNRTITIVVTERNFNPDTFDLIMSKNDADITRNGSKFNWSHSESDENATDKTTHTATYTINKSQEGDYKLSAKATDWATNENNKVTYNGSAPTSFIIDSTKPKIDVSMTGTSANEKYFFNTDRTVKIVVTDRNFDPNDVTVLVNGSKRNISANAWTQDQKGSSRTNNTNNTTEFTISAEADYTFSVTCNDLAENAAEKTNYATDDCERFTIDKTAPTIVISQMVYQSANNGKNDKGEKVDIPITVTVNDTNIGNMYNNNAVTAKEVTETLSISMLNSNSTASSFGVRSSGRNSVTYSSANLTEDGFYTLNLNVKDCAGNPARVVTYPTSKSGGTSTQNISNGVSNFFTFSVNRNGSTYSIDENTKNLVGKYYVQHVENDVVIYEVNVNELQGDLKKNIKITDSNGNELDATDFIDVVLNRNTNNWYRYTYTIHKEFFDPEGEYIISIESQDEANNKGYSSLKMKDKTNLTFVVDRTKPVVTINGVTSNKIYTKDSQHVKVTISDDVLLAKIAIHINGDANPILELEAKDFGDYFVDGQFVWEYDFKESGNKQSIEVKCWDAAENNNLTGDPEIGDKVDNFLVSTNFGDQVKFWIVNHVLPFVIIFVTVAGLIAMIILFIISRKRKANEE